MKRVVIACGCLAMLAAIALMVWMRSDDSPATDEHEEAPQTEAQSPVATGSPSDTSSDSAPAADGSEDAKGLRLPPDADVRGIVTLVKKMAVGTPTSRAQARELSLVLAKYHVELPQVISDLIKIEEETVQPTAAEIVEVGKLNVSLANICRQVQSQYKTDPAVVQAFYAELLLAVASTSPSKQARIRAAHVILKGARPPHGHPTGPRRQVDPDMASRAFVNAIEFTLASDKGDLTDDLAAALAEFHYHGILSAYLTVAMMAVPEGEEKSLDALVLPLIGRAEELMVADLPKRSRKFLEMVLEDMRKHRAQTGGYFAANVQTRREIERFFNRMANAINAEDKNALAEMMPDAASEIKSVGSLRDGWGDMPNTLKVAITGVGLIEPMGEATYRVTVYFDGIAKGGRTNKRSFETLVVRSEKGYCIRAQQ